MNGEISEGIEGDVKTLVRFFDVTNNTYRIDDNSL